MQNKQNINIPINPLSLGIAYFGFSILLLGLEHKTLTTTVLGWVTFGVSVLLFMAIFEKHLGKFIDEKGSIILLSSAGVLAILALVVEVLYFLSGKGGWVVTLFLTFLLLWIVVIAGASAGVAKKKNWVFLVALFVFILSVTKFAYLNYVQGGFLLAFSIFLFLVAKGIIKLPEPPEP